MDTFLDTWLFSCVIALIVLPVAGYLPPRNPIVLRLGRALNAWDDWRYQRRWLARLVREHQAPVVTVQASCSRPGPAVNPVYPPPPAVGPTGNPL